MTEKVKSMYKFPVIALLIVLTAGVFPLVAQSNGDPGFSSDEAVLVFGKKNRPWNFARLTIAPYYVVTLPGGLSSILPYQSGLILSFDHGIHHAFKPKYRKKSPFIPGLKFDLGVNFHGPSIANSFSASGGLIWLIPLAGDRFGSIHLSGTAGAIFMSAQFGAIRYTNTAGLVSANLGYELSFSSIYLSLMGKFVYIMDSSLPWMGAGGQIGIGYKFKSPEESIEE